MAKENPLIPKAQREVADRLRALLGERPGPNGKPWSQSALASVVGLSRASFSMYLAYRTPLSANMIFKAAAALGAHPLDIDPECAIIAPEAKRWMPRGEGDGMTALVEENARLRYTLERVRAERIRLEEG